MQHGAVLFCIVCACFGLFVRAFRVVAGINGSSPKAGAKGLPCGIVRAVELGRSKSLWLLCACICMGMYVMLGCVMLSCAMSIAIVRVAFEVEGGESSIM